MKKSLVVLALVAGCGASGEQNGSAARQGNAASAVAAPASPAPSATARPSDALLGLWQAGSAKYPDQLCVVRRGDTPQFGLVVWGPNMRSCSGAGTVTRDGDRLTLTMTGDSACAIPARVQGGRLTLTGPLPQGCAYYCGAGAKLQGAVFTQVGTKPADAAKAKDLAGDPLCG